MKCVIFLFGFLAGVMTADHLEPVQPPAAICDTDTDCMRFCPPHDPGCDGGPQS